MQVSHQVCMSLLDWCLEKMLHHFLAQCVSQFHAMLFRQMHPRASETILKSTYMDDSMILS